MSMAHGVLERALANLFFFFFCAQIFSPYVAGVTIYLEILLALVNPFFLRWIARLPIRRQYVACASVVGVAGVIAGPQVLVKAVAIGVGVLFLFYATERNLFFLFRYLVLSVVVAIAQFALVLLDSPLAMRIGPSHLSALVWGDYATETYTNFFAIFVFPRVSGLSREAGFLASLLVVSAALAFIEWKRGNAILKPAGARLIAVGFVISLSRSTLGLPILLALDEARRFIAAVPFFYLVGAFFIVLAGLTLLFDDVLLQEQSGSLLHRFGGYAVVFDIDVPRLMAGGADLSGVSSRFVYALPEHLGGQFTGLAGFILKYGVVAATILLIGLYLGGVTSVGIAFLLVATANVDLLTNQNFVILSYYTVFRFYTRRVRF